MDESGKRSKIRGMVRFWSSVRTSSLKHPGQSTASDLTRYDNPTGKLHSFPNHWRNQIAKNWLVRSWLPRARLSKTFVVTHSGEKMDQNVLNMARFWEGWSLSSIDSVIRNNQHVVQYLSLLSKSDRMNMHFDFVISEPPIPNIPNFADSCKRAYWQALHNFMNLCLMQKSLGTNVERWLVSCRTSFPRLTGTLSQKSKSPAAGSITFPVQ